MIDITKHPCFNKDVKNKSGRVHLPVAPKCNVQCNYCNRKYDCANETRPGVTSKVLQPDQAINYLGKLTKLLPNMAVAGIAGPGDPFANPEETMATLSKVREEFPDMILCVSTNGANLKKYIPELAKLNVTHVTITLNSLRPETIAKIYSWFRIDKKVFRGTQGAEIFLKQQLECIDLLKEHNIMVKINTIFIPGINEDEIEEVAIKMAELNADTMNCIPLQPVEDTLFENLEEPTKEKMKVVKALIAKHLKPMEHCSRCRADAAGLLGKDEKSVPQLLSECTEPAVIDNKNKTRVAAASHEGLLVNQHLGEAMQLYIYEESKNGYKFIEKRETPAPGGGDQRWLKLADILHDCRALLTGGAGKSPVTVLQNSGVKVIQMTGLIDTGLDSVYKGTVLRTLKKADEMRCGEGCTGNAQGCA